MKSRLITMLLLCSSTCLNSQQCLNDGIFLSSMPPCPSGDYHLVFEDNFDGNTLDMSTWNPITGVPRDNDLEHQKAWHLPANIEVSDGNLKIFGKKLTSAYTGTWVSDWSTSPPTTKTSDFDFSTGEIWTDKKFLFGKYEARCRVPIGKGYWPAFWTYGDDQRWNEIDIFELYGDDADRFTCNVHHDYNGDGGSEMCSFDQNNAVNSFADWHTFTCIFEFDRIIWQIDGVTVRSHYRFRTLSAAVVTCEDNLSVGSYVTQQAFPLDSMHIVFNLAIQSNENAPDDNTIFPGMFEIDYIRYYKKIENPCMGCLDHIIYENTTQLPELTRTSNYIKATSNTTVQNGQNVRFKAPVIILEPSFEVEIGANFSAIPENCTLSNYEDAAVSFIGDNTIDGYQLISSTFYTIETTGVLFYSFKVYDLQGQLIHNISGVPSSNQIILWNTADIATALYSVRLELSNCTDTLANEYNLLVSDLYKSLNVISDSTNVPFDSISIKTKKLLIYPNPAHELLNIVVNFTENNVSYVKIIDLLGSEHYNRNEQFNAGINSYVIDVSEFRVGMYYLKVTNDFESFVSPFVVN